MSAVLGYERGVMYNNDIINRNRSLQSAIHTHNLANLNNYNVLEKRSKSQYQSTEGGLDEAKTERTETTAEHEGGEFLGGVRNVYKSAKAYGKLAEDLKNKASEIHDVVNPLVSGGGEFKEAGKTAELSKTAIKQGAKMGHIIAPVKATESAVATTEAISHAGEGISSGVSAMGKISGALDSVGKLGEGLSVVSGISDTIDDAMGGWSKMNNAEKVGNVAGITSGVFGAGSLAGGLESVGLALDSTGIGAEVGLALNVAGAIAGGVSAISDLIGGEQKQKPQQATMKKSVRPQPQAQAQAPISAQQSGGVALSGYN